MLFRSDELWARRLSGLEGARNLKIAHAPAVLSTVEQKAALFRKSGASAADMESYGVADVAVRRGFPFIALRAVADTAHDAVPPVGIASMGPDGRVRMGAAVLGAVTHPWQIPGLMRLGAQTARVKEALRTLARAPGGFGLA